MGGDDTSCHNKGSEYKGFCSICKLLRKRKEINQRLSKLHSHTQRELEMHTNPLLHNYFTKQVYTDYFAVNAAGPYFFYAIVPDNVSRFAAWQSKGPKCSKKSYI